eukprot:CAMPEP_0206156742 /NCGR_PEP_ID=MMETSP1474-20131121/3270_1 /ASSEMBLY_ACC=CAM_ASM_001110 /TAXON_ID=97495 /ORGANISM="Imantonia sp., Strain RCC918" /LENGTH=167 /DNA_ID=CAMNT_0053555965 /DNA_START=30 /DNA_END=530 /DNA_ORIENTATION=+
MAEGEFEPHFKEEFDSKHKMVDVNGKKIALYLHDTAGQEKFRALTSSYYRNSNAIIATFDITNEESFDDVEGYLVEGTRFSSRALKFIVGNKCDLDSERKISYEKAKQKADKLEVPYFEVSAKSGTNVDNLEKLLLEELVKTFPDDDEDLSLKLSKTKKSGTNVDNL